MAHWVWHPSGWLFVDGALDFAGGTVVHINAGVAGLVAAIVLGKRVGFGTENMAPHNLGLAVIGASLLWVGWFGFNAGSAASSGGGRAAMAMLVTQVAAAGAVLSWVFAEWMIKGKPSVLGAISGAVAGLVAITPAAGFVLPGSALIIGVVAGLAGYWGATALKHALGYDDSLDAFGVHGICGIVGALLVGFLAYGPLSGHHRGAGRHLGLDGPVHQAVHGGGRDRRLHRRRDLHPAQGGRRDRRPPRDGGRGTRGPRRDDARRAHQLTRRGSA